MARLHYKTGILPIPEHIPAVILDAARYVSHSLFSLHYSSLSVYEETSSAVCAGFDLERFVRHLCMSGNICLD
jgi:hypothetical protein